MLIQNARALNSHSLQFEQRPLYIRSIALGCCADLILCDENLNIHTVLIDGKPVKEAET